MWIFDVICFSWCDKIDVRNEIDKNENKQLINVFTLFIEWNKTLNIVDVNSNVNDDVNETMC